MSRKKRRAPNKIEEQKKKIDKPTLYKNLLRLLVLVAITLAVYLVYNVFIDLYFYPVMISYTVITTVAVFAYVIYNRAMSRKGITEDMLPVEWDIEKKREFIEDGKRRLDRSRWMLVCIIALIVTFVAEAVTLFLLPLFDAWF